MGQKSFINILLIRNILLQAVFSKAELLANASPREIETHVLLSGTRCWKIWEFISKPQPLMLGWGILFPVSTFMFFLCYFYIHPQHAKSGVIHKSTSRMHHSIFSCSWMIQYKVSCPFSLVHHVSSCNGADPNSKTPWSRFLLAHWLSQCPCLSLGHRQMAPVGMPHSKWNELQSKTELRTKCLHISYTISIFSTNTCNHNIFWISSLQECLCILAFIPGQNKN